jgi:hypothetical protein
MRAAVLELAIFRVNDEDILSRADIEKPAL